MLTGHQLQAARILAGLGEDELGRRAGLPRTTIATLEAHGSAEIPERAEGQFVLRRALETAGLQFVSEGGRGVIMRRPGPVDEGMRPEALNAD